MNDLLRLVNHPHWGNIVGIPASQDPNTPEGLESQLSVRICRILAELPHSTELELRKLHRIWMDSCLHRLWALNTLSTASTGHIDKMVFENAPTHGCPTKVMWPAGHTLARLSPWFVPGFFLVSYFLCLCLILDIMKICMDFGPYGAFPSSDVLEMLDQQNAWNLLVISTFLLYLEWNVGTLAVNVCILWPPTMG
jgi:hypothetical protein